jgi:hypothetical protein
MKANWFEQNVIKELRVQYPEPTEMPDQDGDEKT